MVTYCATKLTATYSPMIGQFVDTMILASTDKDVVIMIHQTVSLGKYCKLFPSTLKHTKTYQNFLHLSYLNDNGLTAMQ